MIKIGITGNIASGKTTVSNFFKNKNAFIFNADKEAKKHIKNHSSLQKKIISTFGQNIVLGNSIDFKKLSKIAFINKKNQNILNGLVWPEVSILIDNAAKKALKNKYEYFIVDAALLFEANFQHFFNYIILVTANKELRISRAVKRRTIDLYQIKKRMDLQMPDNEKISMCDFVIKNNNIDALKISFNEIFKKII